MWLTLPPRLQEGWHLVWLSNNNALVWMCTRSEGQIPLASPLKFPEQLHTDHWRVPGPPLFRGYINRLPASWVPILYATWKRALVDHPSWQNERHAPLRENFTERPGFLSALDNGSSMTWGSQNKPTFHLWTGGYAGWLGFAIGWNVK